MLLEFSIYGSKSILVFPNLRILFWILACLIEPIHADANPVNNFKVVSVRKVFSKMEWIDSSFLEDHLFGQGVDKLENDRKK